MIIAAQVDGRNCFFPRWGSGAETVAQNWKNNWVTLFPQSTFFRKISPGSPSQRHV